MREPVKLQFDPDGDDFKPKRKPVPDASDRVEATQKPTVSESTSKAIAAQTASQAEGFTSRSGGKSSKIDGRSLRRTGRTQQMNISVSPKTKDRFLSLVHDGGFKAGGEFLDHLLDLYERGED